MQARGSPHDRVQLVCQIKEAVSDRPCRHPDRNEAEEPRDRLIFCHCQRERAAHELGRCDSIAGKKRSVTRRHPVGGLAARSGSLGVRPWQRFTMGLGRPARNATTHGSGDATARRIAVISRRRLLPTSEELAKPSRPSSASTSGIVRNRPDRASSKARSTDDLPSCIPTLPNGDAEAPPLPWTSPTTVLRRDVIKRCKAALVPRLIIEALNIVCRASHTILTTGCQSSGYELLHRFQASYRSGQYQPGHDPWIIRRDEHHPVER